MPVAAAPMSLSMVAAASTAAAQPVSVGGSPSRTLSVLSPTVRARRRRYQAVSVVEPLEAVGGGEK